MSEKDPQDPAPLDAEIDSALEGQSIMDIAAAAERGDRLLEEDSDVQVGRVVDVSDTDVLVEFSAREQGVCPIGQFARRPEVGASLPFRIEGHDRSSGLAMLSLPRQTSSHARWADLDEGRVVRARVTGHNSGGLELEVAGHRAFMPLSHISLERVEDPEEYVGRALECEIIELDRARDKVVCSCRSLRERVREESRALLAEGLVVGSAVRGKITRLEPYGAFVELGGGVEGLLHVSNLAWERVEHPESVVQLGQEVEVQVLSVEEGGRRIGLGLKQLQPDPWFAFRDEHPPDAIVPGTVTRVVDFGAFVQVAPGVEGLLHKSQLAPQRVSRVRRFVNEGDELEVRVAEYDEERRRIGLSRLTPKGRPLGDESEADDEDVQQYLAPRSEDAADRGTSLGNLLRDALERREENPAD
jgi:small subunit ribosomal protein S1